MGSRHDHRPGHVGEKNSFANGINDRRQIVGGSQINDVISPVLGFPPFYPVLWHKGRMLNLGPGPGNMGAAAFNINNRTQVVGRFAAPDPDVGAVAHAFLWQRGVIHDLGVPAGDQDSEALSLNNRGQIVGDSGAGFIETYSADRALLWGRSGPTDLNTLIPADSGYYPILAFDANDEGEIVVCAVQLSTGNVHAVLLKPDELNMRDRAAMAMTIAPSKVKPQMSGNARRLLEAGRRRKRGEVDRAK